MSNLILKLKLRLCFSQDLDWELQYKKHLWVWKKFQYRVPDDTVDKKIQVQEGGFGFE